MASIIDIEGIGPTYAAKLKKAGVRSTDRLLKVAADKQGRKELALRSGISETLILEWVNLADLFRIKGIGPEYSDLLEEAGVDAINAMWAVMMPQQDCSILLTAHQAIGCT